MKFLQIVLITGVIVFSAISLFAWYAYGESWLFFFLIPYLIITCGEVIGSGLFHHNDEVQEDYFYSSYGRNLSI
ncbi:MAG: hypothetical protein ACFFDR_11565 [Candidatus Thorarchaeota archaeon]